MGGEKMRKLFRKKEDRMIPLTIHTMNDKRTLVRHADDIVTSHKKNKDLVAVFEDTRKQSKSVKARAIVNVMGIDDDATLVGLAKEQKIEFVKCGTVKAGRDLVKNKAEFDKVAILNFADALVPGGLVLYGAPTQEENICRCSNLYETLLECPVYYNLNRQNGTDIYLDNMIYSENVTVFKDDETYENVEPMLMDVITCPAPSMHLSDDMAEKIFIRRIRKILVCAQNNGVNKIVLGAWGCGAFGQSPIVVGRAFAKVLSEQNAFDEVVFAIKSSEGLDESRNYTEFKRAFDYNYVR